MPRARRSSRARCSSVGPATRRLAALRRDLLKPRASTPVDECPSGGGSAAVVADLTEAQEPADLEALRARRPRAQATAAERPGHRRRPRPARADGPAQAAARRALEGITRSIGKELRAGATANLVLVDDGRRRRVDAGACGSSCPARRHTSTARWSASAAARPPAPPDWAGRWPARWPSSPEPPAGIGAAIADALARDGATVVCVDVPAAGEPGPVANRVGGTALQLDVTRRTPGGGSSSTPAPGTAARHRRAQRRHHPRQAARQHGRRPLGTRCSTSTSGRSCG